MKNREYAISAGNLLKIFSCLSNKKRYGQTDRIMDGQTELCSSFAINNDKICTRNEVSLDQPVFSSKKSLIMIGLSAFCQNPLPLKYTQTFSKIA